MRKHFISGLAFVAAASGGLLLAGCGGETKATSSTQSAVAISVTGQSSADTWLRVTAVDIATNTAVAIEHAELHGGAAAHLVMQLDPSSYRFDLSAYTDAAELNAAAQGSATVQVAAGATTVLQLAVPDISAGGSGGAGGGASGSGSITLTAQSAPLIDSIAVSAGSSASGTVSGVLDGNGQIAGDLTGAGAATIAIGALTQTIDANGNVTGTAGASGLRYFWAGSTIQGAVEGSSSLQLDAKTVAADLAGVVSGESANAQHSVHVVVQDASGAASSAEVQLSTTLSGLVATFSSFRASVENHASAAIEKVAACQEAHAGCVATCNASATAHTTGTGGDASANANCLASCGLSLASCEAK